MRDYIEERISIDGRNIPYRLVTACDYFGAKEFTDEQIEELYEDGIGDLVVQVMALKQSIYLMRRVSLSDGSLADGLQSLKERLIKELVDKYGFDFDEGFVDNYGFSV